MNQLTELTQSQKKRFKAIGHQLNPIVIIGDAGISEGIIKEVNRALEDHELIKIKLPAGDRELKKQLISEICVEQNCQVIQQIGNTALLYRPAQKPNPRLSNLLKQKS